MEINFVETSPGPVKAALALMGLIEPHYRLPMVPPQPENLARIEQVLAKSGLIAPFAASAD
jgi:4-hydroxy-tetrahydrodipicolinate synthase